MKTNLISALTIFTITVGLLASNGCKKEKTPVVNKTTYTLQRWTTPGQITSLPRAYNGTEPLAASQGTFSSRGVDNAAYIRLKTATLSYSLPLTLLRHTGFGGLTVFAQGLNLLTFTHFRGDDPENTGTNLNFYPNERTLTAGIKAKF